MFGTENELPNHRDPSSKTIPKSATSRGFNAASSLLARQKGLSLTSGGAANIGDQYVDDTYNNNNNNNNTDNGGKSYSTLQKQTTYSRLERLFKDKHSSEQYERHIVGIERYCRAHSLGIVSSFLSLFLPTPFPSSFKNTIYSCQC